MINFINTVLQFDFVIDTYIPLLITKILFFTVISIFVGTIISFIEELLKNTILVKLFDILEGILYIIIGISMILLALMIIMLPILLTIIAIKFYILSLIPVEFEFLVGIISMILCFSIVAIAGIIIFKD